jgi:hypothetical protein
MANTDPDATPMTWAASLTPAELASQLRRLVQDPHVLDPDERKAVMLVAAAHLETPR